MKNLLRILLVALITGSSFAQTARVQVVHNSPDLAAATVDIYVNGVNALDDTVFRSASAFLDLPAGVPIDIDIAPGNSTSVGDSIFNANVTLTDGETYIVVAYGILPSSTGYSNSPPFGLEIFPMAREAAADPTLVDVLVHHGSTDAPTVDIVETSVPAGTVVDNISTSEFAGYLSLDEEDYTVEVRTGDGLTAVAAYEAPLATLSLQGAAITVYASGFLDPTVNNNGPAFGLWATTALGGPMIELPSATVLPPARVQVVHNSADLAAATVDVYLNEVNAVDDFEFRTATPFIDVVAASEIELSVAPGTSTSVADALLTVPVTLESGETYIVTAYGIVSATGYSPAPPLSLEVFAGAREAAVDPATVDILVHHGATDAPTVDVVETGVGAGTLVDDISPTEYQGYLAVPEDDYNLEIRLADGVTQVAGYSAPLATLGLEGAAISVFASGFLDPAANSNGPAFGLWVSTAAGGALIELPAGTLNVDDFANNSFVVYPNPTTDFLVVEGVDTTGLAYVITDVKGRSVANGNLFSNNTITTTGLSQGLYILNLLEGNRIVSSQKIMKQ